MSKSETRHCVKATVIDNPDGSITIQSWCGEQMVSATTLSADVVADVGRIIAYRAGKVAAARIVEDDGYAD